MEEILKVEEILEEKNQTKKFRILIVDDEQYVRDILTFSLGEEYLLDVACDGKEAIEKLELESYDLVITDLKMPRVNGIEVIKHVKKIKRETEVIVITGFGSIETAISSMKEGAIDYIQKPFNIEYIKLVVKRTLESIHHRKQAIELDFYKKLSQIDGLTELYNHRYFHQLLDTEISRSNRFNFQLSLAMIDVDFFKIYNDALGHPMGDLALKKLSYLLKKLCRDYDFIARYGGEEFAVVLPQTDKEQSTIITKRVIKSIEDTEFDGEEVLPSKKFTISAGLATYPIDAKTKDDLIYKADQSLYKAKSSGKNRLCVYYHN